MFYLGFPKLAAEVESTFYKAIWPNILIEKLLGKVKIFLAWKTLFILKERILKDKIRGIIPETFGIKYFL